MPNPVVRPVRLDDEPLAVVRLTQLEGPSLAYGASIAVEVDGKWIDCVVDAPEFSGVHVWRKPKR